MVRKKRRYFRENNENKKREKTENKIQYFSRFNFRIFPVP